MFNVDEIDYRGHFHQNDFRKAFMQADLESVKKD